MLAFCSRHLWCLPLASTRFVGFCSGLLVGVDDDSRSIDRSVGRVFTHKQTIHEYNGNYPDEVLISNGNATYADPNAWIRLEGEEFMLTLRKNMFSIDAIVGGFGRYKFENQQRPTPVDVKQFTPDATSTAMPLGDFVTMASLSVSGRLSTKSSFLFFTADGQPPLDFTPKLAPIDDYLPPIVGIGSSIIVC